MFDRSARINTERVKRQMEAAGFVDFTEKTIRCYVNPWGEDKEQNLAAQWFNLSLIEGVQAMSLAPMIENLGMGIDEINALQNDVKAECCKLRYHAYCTM